MSDNGQNVTQMVGIVMEGDVSLSLSAERVSVLSELRDRSQKAITTSAYSGV